MMAMPIKIIRRPQSSIAIITKYYLLTMIMVPFSKSVDKFDWDFRFLC